MKTFFATLVVSLACFADHVGEPSAAKVDDALSRYIPPGASLEDLGLQLGDYYDQVYDIANPIIEELRKTILEITATLMILATLK